MPSRAQVWRVFDYVQHQVARSLQTPRDTKESVNVVAESIQQGGLGGAHVVLQRRHQGAV